MANLSGVDFSRAILRGTILLRANLLWASFRGTILRGTILVRADLSGADLKGAILREATLSGTTLFGASLSETIFSDTNLAGAKGLDTCIHVGPSTIDYRTLLLSGRLPLEFLRGCGVPSELQDALPNIMAKVK